jgi:hypothetical protein
MHFVDFLLGSDTFQLFEDQIVRGTVGLSGSFQCTSQHQYLSRVLIKAIYHPETGLLQSKNV